MSNGPSRREALAWLGAGGSLASLLGTVVPRPSFAVSTHAIVPYHLDDPENQTVTTCAGCTGGCAVRGSRAGEVLSKVDGNPWSPRQGGSADLSGAVAAKRRGTSCARGQARVNNVHDPWRLGKLLLRDGDRGSGKFRSVAPVDWLAAVLNGTDGGPGLVGLHQEARGDVGPARVVVAVDPRHQDRRPLLRALAKLEAGTVTILGHPAPELAGGTERILGQPGFLAAPQWDRATLGIAWGADPVATGLDPVGSARALVGRRDSLIAVDPRLSTTAALAGTWLPVRPGGDGLLAAWVLRRWVELGRVPATALSTGLQARPVGQLEHGTGLGADLVDRLAERIWAAGPGLAIAVGSGLHADALDAVLALAAWTGALDPGGAMAPVADPNPAIDGPRTLHELLAAEVPPDVVILVGDATRQDGAWHAPSLALLADPGRVRRVVWVGTAPSALMGVADAVLPDVTEFERTGLVRRHDGVSVVLPSVASVPGGRIEAPLGAGLEGLIDALAVALGSPPVAAATFTTEVEAAAAGLSPLAPEDEPILTAALGARLPELAMRSPSARALLFRGWIAPPAGPAAPPALRNPVADLGDGDDGVVLVPFCEPFGGQADSDAQVFASRAVKTANEAWIHPDTYRALPGDDTGWVRLTAGTAWFDLPAKPTQEVRLGCVALARGYGQKFGYSGNLVIDGATLPVAARRCEGVPVSPLLGPPLGLTRTEAPEPESWFEQLFPGGHRQATRPREDG